MKLRLIPIIISVVVSAVVLFGGWFAYNSYAMEHPLSDIVNKAPGVESSTTNFSSTQVMLELKLKQDANLREIIQQITKQGSSIIGQRELVVRVNGQSSPKLDAWWSKALFDVAQSMETKQYADIPLNLQAKAASEAGLTVDTQMDSKYVYVRLSEGTSSKFIMLPRVSAKMGVWPNE
jgi:K+-sensing histidine kinase KdpD